MTNIQLIPGLPAGTPIEDRVAYGRAARKKLPRKELGAWQPPADRPRGVDLIKEQAKTRIPLLVPYRHARMAVSPFTFYRGAAIIMAADLGLSPSTGISAQICGDAHLANFGVFGSAERNLVFDVNDFDETNPGPFEWDLCRLTASLVLAARDNSLGDEVGHKAAVAAAESYQRVMGLAANRPYLDNWYTMLTPDEILAYTTQQVDKKLAQKAGKRIGKSVAKARSRDAWSAINKLTEVGPDGQRRFINQPPMLMRIAELPEGVRRRQELPDFGALMALFNGTLDPDRAALLDRYRIIDIAHKVVGVGSVGLPALIGLLQGRDDDDLMVLQFKAAEASVLEKWTAPSVFEEHGQRVVFGQRLMQATGDPFLGWLTGPAGVAFYGRQLRDFKWSVDLAGLQAGSLDRYGALCGATLALAHARAGDPVAMAAYIGKSDSFPEALGSFAMTYADLVLKDYQDFTDAIASGELPAVDGDGS